LGGPIIRIRKLHFTRRNNHLHAEEIVAEQTLERRQGEEGDRGRLLDERR